MVVTYLFFFEVIEDLLELLKFMLLLAFDTYLDVLLSALRVSSFVIRVRW